MEEQDFATLGGSRWDLTGGRVVVEEEAVSTYRLPTRSSHRPITPIDLPPSHPLSRSPRPLKGGWDPSVLKKAHTGTRSTHVHFPSRLVLGT